jgi:outer membrane protein OmpA-like peptidoglycan-associated protein
MTPHDAFRVPGEDFGWSVSVLLGAIGVACATAVVSLTTAASEPPRAPVAATATTTAPAPSAPPASTPSWTAAPSTSTRAPAGPLHCTPISITFLAGAGEAPAATERLQKLAAWMDANPAATATIDGHADMSGDDQSNLILSRRRAKWVASTLEAAGVRKERMTVRAFGTYAPIEGTAEDASDNRRVLLVTKGADGCPADLEEGN